MISSGNVSAANARAAQDLLKARRHPLDSIFTPHQHSLGRSQRAPRFGRPHRALESHQQPFRRHHLSGQSQAQPRPRHSRIRFAARAARGSRPCRRLHSGRKAFPPSCAQCVELGVPAAIVISAGFKETGEHGEQLEAQILQVRPGLHAHRRPQLGRRHESDSRPQRYLFQHHGAPRQRRLHQPERRPMYGDSRLGQS